MPGKLRKERFRHSLDLGTRSMLHGEQAFEFGRPIVAGDRLTVRSKVADVQERLQMRVSELDIEIHEDEFQYWRKFDRLRKGRS